VDSSQKNGAIIYRNPKLLEMTLLVMGKERLTNRVNKSWSYRVM